MSDDEQTKKSVAFGDTTDLENGEAVQLPEDAATAEPHSVSGTNHSANEMELVVEQGAVEGEGFDPTQKKKKKRVKEAPAENGEEPKENGEAAAFDPSSMKKKKSKKKEGAEGETADGGEGGFDATAMKKKKKKKPAGEETSFEKRLAELNLEGEKADEPAVEQTPEEIEAELQAGAGPWAQEATAPLKYTQLLKRFYINLYEDHPELSGDGRLKNYKIPPPQVVREGNKKSIFVNLPEIARKMKRNPDHIIQFIFAELGTNGSVDGSGRLVIKGRFQQKQLESVLRRYIVEYLTCGTCKSPNTTLNKENRLFFVSCNICGSRKSVSAIKTGFQAAIGKRKKLLG